ncbi:hypothetical protein ACOMHN_014801 [Nucella lapillus]
MSKTARTLSRIITVTSREESASLENLPIHGCSSPLSRHRSRILSQESRSRSMTDVRTGQVRSPGLYQQRKNESRFLPSCQAQYRRSPFVVQKTPRSTPDLVRTCSDSSQTRQLQIEDRNAKVKLSEKAGKSAENDKAGKEQHTVPSHFANSPPQWNNEIMDTPSPYLTEQHRRFHQRVAVRKKNRKDKNSTSVGASTKETSDKEDDPCTASNKTSTSNASGVEGVGSDGERGGRGVRNAPSEEITDVLFNDKALAMDTDSWSRLFTRMRSPRKSPGKKKLHRYAVKQENTPAVAVLRSSSDVTSGLSSSSGSGQRQRRHRKERPYKSDPLADGGGIVSNRGMNYRGTNNRVNTTTTTTTTTTNNNNNNNNIPNQQGADDVMRFLQEGGDHPPG